MAASLEKNAALIKLHFWENDITDEGAESLCKALRVNTVLTELDLSGKEK